LEYISELIRYSRACGSYNIGIAADKGASEPGLSSG
jgi:hypothetical protein